MAETEIDPHPQVMINIGQILQITGDRVHLLTIDNLETHEAGRQIDTLDKLPQEIEIAKTPDHL